MEDGELDAREERALASWLAAAPRHRGALIRARAIWSTLDRSRALHAPVHPSPAEEPATMRWHGRRDILGVAASAACAMLLAPSTSHGTVRFLRTGAEISAPFPLESGSVCLDCNSEALVAGRGVGAGMRMVFGRAWVQGDNGACVLSAGDVRLSFRTASLILSRTRDMTEALILAGTVNATMRGRGQAIALGPGSLLRQKGDSTPIVDLLSADDRARQTAWTRGMVEFQTETLGEAAALFNRYNGRKLFVHGDALAARSLVGVFALHDPAAFARMAKQVLHADYVETPGRIDLY
ncbi:hypothetical protein HLH44_05000 [Gluconacetobacter sp. 1c LMG 22058]|uniref:Uncharacterized protein n=2 Tax=Gluconacetobacter dulcium TaxID=2729096 RepID=A0A7W4PJF4_9PROT|nr:hypothetical protein [Gluconacetobacter dulcium]